MELPSLLSCTTCLLAAINAANATPVSSAHPPKSTDLGGKSSSHTAFRNVGYYGNWKTYHNFTVADIPAEQYTHIIYSFAKVDKTTGEVKLDDDFADTDKHFPGEMWDDKPDVHGNVKQLYLLKKKNRSLKTLLSIGGYEYSKRGQFEPVLASESMRSNFARSVVHKMYDLGFDGISLDYEYVASTTECEQMIDLLKKIRAEMESYAKSTNSTPFIISYASPAGEKNYKFLDMPAMDKYIDQWDFMAYDYSGTWDPTSGHSANLFADSKNPSHTPFNTESAMDYYLNVGKIDPSKINLGLPLYGHAFVKNNGPGTTMDQAASVQAGDKGSFLYKDLPLPGSNAKVVELPELGASYSIDAAKEHMVSYDTPNIARQKAKWIKEKGLGGSMFWEVSGDKTGDESLVATVVKELGKLEKSKNHLNYPQSQYDNLKNGMKGEGEEVMAKGEEPKDEGKKDEAVTPKSEAKKEEAVAPKPEEHQETTTEVGAPTSTSTSSSTSTSIPAPTTTQPEIVAEITAPATTTALSTSAFSTFYSIFGAGPTLTITKSEPLTESMVEADEEEGAQDQETEEEESNGEKNQVMKDTASLADFKKTKKGSKKSASNAGPTAPQFGLIVAGSVLFFLL